MASEPGASPRHFQPREKAQPRLALRDVGVQRRDMLHRLFVTAEPVECLAEIDADAVCLDTLYRAGYRVLARFVVWEETAALQAPTSALFRAGDAWSVFVVADGAGQHGMQHLAGPLAEITVDQHGGDGLGHATRAQRLGEPPLDDRQRRQVAQPVDVGPEDLGRGGVFPREVVLALLRHVADEHPPGKPHLRGRQPQTLGLERRPERHRPQPLAGPVAVITLGGETIFTTAPLDAGFTEITIDLAGLASGVYFVDPITNGSAAQRFLLK